MVGVLSGLASLNDSRLTNPDAWKISFLLVIHELRKASSRPSADITTMAHLDNLIQTLSLRLRFCLTQPRCRLRRVVTSSSSCRASKQSSRFYSSKTLTTTKTDDINISTTAYPHNLIRVTLPATALLPLITNSFALEQDTVALST